MTKYIFLVAALGLSLSLSGCGGSPKSTAKTEDEVRAFSGDSSKMSPEMAEKIKKASEPSVNPQQAK